jgi:DNA-binding MarR family transcriptional regulator
MVVLVCGGRASPTDRLDRAVIAPEGGTAHHAGDRLAIAELLFRYAYGLDGHAPEVASSCFLPDGHFETGGEEITGRSALAAWLGAGTTDVSALRAGVVATQTRVVSNVMVRFSGDRAHAESIMIETTVRRQDDAAGSVVRCVRHNDDLVRIDDGWLIERRQQVPQWTDEDPLRDPGGLYADRQRSDHLGGNAGKSERFTQYVPKGQLEESLGREIWKTLEVHRRRSIAKLAEHGIDDLSAPHLHLLSACAPEALRPIELARRNQMSPQALNHLLSSMERRGYLCRSNDSEHPRRRFIRLTAKGRRALDIAVAAALEVEAEIQEEVGAEAFDGFQRVLAAFTKKWNA